jgi:long-chain acyl-CoA synthetase
LVETTIANLFQGYMTAAQKLQRKKIVSHFQKDIDRAYGKK